MKTLLNPRHHEELRRRLEHLEPTATARWGRMSAHQLVCHLADAFSYPLGEKMIAPVRTKYPRAVMRFIAFYVPLRWPRGFPAPREIRQGSGGTPPAEFGEDLRRAIATMDRFAAAGPRLSECTHPIFGRISAWEWGRWGYLHTDHHLRQFNR